MIAGPAGRADRAAHRDRSCWCTAPSVPRRSPPWPPPSAARGAQLIDAAVTRTRFGAAPGPFVLTMTGGDAALTERARPVLSTFSTQVVHAGPLGAGMALKITNNFVTWVHVLAIQQAFSLAQAGGVEIDKLREVMSGNGNLTPVSRAVLEGLLRDAGAHERGTPGVRREPGQDRREGPRAGAGICAHGGGEPVAGAHTRARAFSSRCWAAERPCSALACAQASRPTESSPAATRRSGMQPARRTCPVALPLGAEVALHPHLLEQAARAPPARTASRACRCAGQGNPTARSSRAGW